MKYRSVAGLVVVSMSFAPLAQALPTHIIRHTQDFGQGQPYQAAGQTLHVQAQVHTDTPIHFSDNTTFRIDAGHSLHLGGTLSATPGLAISLIKQGLGALSLEGPSLLMGPIVVNEGSVLLRHPEALNGQNASLSLAPGTRLDYAPGLNVFGTVLIAGKPEPEQAAVQWQVAQGLAIHDGEIHGSGRIQKTGAGSLRWSENSRVNFSGWVDVQQGALQLGTDVAASFMVHAGAELQLWGGTQQAVQIHGGARLRLGQNGPGRARVLRQLNLDPGSSLIVRVWADGQHDFLQAGSATLAGNLQVQAEGDDWTAPRRYVWLQTEQSLQGRFDQLIHDQAESVWALNYLPQAVELVFTPSASRAKVAAHPYNALFGSVLDDATHIVRWQHAFLRPTGTGWWMHAQHQAQSSLRLQGQAALDRHADWLLLGGQQQWRANTLLLWQLALAQQRWSGLGKFTDFQSRGHNVQGGLAIRHDFGLWQLQFGGLYGVHRVRHLGAWQASGSALRSQYLYARLDYTLWQDPEYLWQLWGQADALRLQQPAWHIKSGQTAFRLQTSRAWQAVPSLGLRFEWRKKSWPEPAKLHTELSWQASPSTQRSKLSVSGAGAVADPSPYRRGQRWSWRMGLDAMLQSGQQLRFYYQADTSRQGGSDHGVGLQYEYRY